jgi:hypothetical protein
VSRHEWSPYGAQRLTELTLPSGEQLRIGDPVLCAVLPPPAPRKRPLWRRGTVSGLWDRGPYPVTVRMALRAAQQCFRLEEVRSRRVSRSNGPPGQTGLKE